MKSKILFVWGNPYAFQNLEYLIDYLSQDYQIDVIITSETNTESVEKFCLENKNIKYFFTYHFNNMNIFGSSKNYIKLKKWLKKQDYKICIAGDECQEYSKFILGNLKSETKKIIFWTHTSYLLQKKNIIKSFRSGNLQYLKDTSKTLELSPVTKTKNLLKYFKFKDWVYINNAVPFRKWPIRTFKIIIFRLAQIIRKILNIADFYIAKIIINNQNLLVKKRNLADNISQVGSGNYDCYLIITQTDVNMFNFITEKKCAHLTSHPLSYKKNPINSYHLKKNVLYFPLSILSNSDEKDFVNIAKNSIDIINSCYAISKVIVRKHPRENNKNISSLIKMLNENSNIHYEVEDGNRPIQSEVLKYDICFTTLSAVIMDIRASNSRIKIIVSENLSKNIAPEPKMYFDEKDGIYWIDQQYNLNNEVFKKKEFPNYSSININNYF